MAGGPLGAAPRDRRGRASAAVRGAADRQSELLRPPTARRGPRPCHGGMGAPRPRPSGSLRATASAASSPRSEPPARRAEPPAPSEPPAPAEPAAAGPRLPNRRPPGAVARTAAPASAAGRGVVRGSAAGRRLVSARRVRAEGLRRPRKDRPTVAPSRSERPSRGGVSGWSTPGLTFGLPQMHKEAGERRDFLPASSGRCADLGCEVFVERGSAPLSAIADADYVAVAARSGGRRGHGATGRTSSSSCARRSAKFEQLRRGATLISMLHFPTRPARVRHLEELGIDAVEPRHDRGRPGPPARREQPGGRLERARGGVRDTGAHVAAPDRARSAARSASRSWAPARSASTPWRPRRSTATSSARELLDAIRAAGRRGDDDRPQPDGRRRVPGASACRSPTSSSTRRSGTIRPSR